MLDAKKLLESLATSSYKLFWKAFAKAATSSGCATSKGMMQVLTMTTNQRSSTLALMYSRPQQDRDSRIDAYILYT